MGRSRPRTAPGRYKGGWSLRKVFEVELASENGCTELTVPAAPYAMLDALEKLWLAEGEAPRWELIRTHDAGRAFGQLDQRNGSLAELNVLAQRLAQLDESGLTIFEGLAAMEHRPLDQPFPLPRLIDLAYSTDCCHLVEGVATDAQLGRFCAENGFVPEAGDLPDAAFALLDFARIGKQFREAEGGVFTRGGYVQRREELKQVYNTLDLTLKKPDYAILAELPDGSRVKLPTPLGETVPDEPVRCVDCAAPALAGLAAMRSTLDLLARRLADLEANGGLPKYKAVLEATGCGDIARALTLADELDQYIFSPNLQGPEAVAMECLEIMLPDSEVELLKPYLDLRGYGEAVVEQDSGKLTGYGYVHSSGPVQDMEQGPEPEEMEMM